MMPLALPPFCRHSPRTTTAPSGPTSPSLSGSQVSRVRTRTSSMSDATAPSTVPSDEVDLRHKHELAALAARHPLGSPLSRVRTRTDSSCLWEHLPCDTPRAPSPAQVLYEDAFVTLTPATLTISHLLFRRAVALPLTRIHAARAFCSPAQLVKLAAASPTPAPPSNRALLRPPRGVAASGLGWTGVLWARDPARMSDARWRDRAVVVEADGWLGRIGFSVEDPGGWWAAWEAATGQPRCL